eukprot:TRINITY_DN5679_c0_g1_i5.p2 TRINITY_DN5679_c0_g1~~TRINITY_DN5679_c0_g1_i5.p2  ORF type:complete len:124 (-),score=18.09 TRINITY_DN5679_c0_g1_i5:346-717(-)
MVNLGSEDYYRNLGVDPQASPEEIEDSYFRLSYRWAPEKNPGSQLARHTYNLIAQAYTTLIDPVTRAAYDKEHCFEPPVGEPRRNHLTHGQRLPWRALRIVPWCYGSAAQASGAVSSVARGSI